MKICSKCSTKNKISAQFCQGCGETLLTTRLVPSGFEPLPVGALLQNRRYEIQALVEQTASYHIYQARDRHHRQCSSCGRLLLEAQNKFCEECGSVVAEAIENPLLTLWESANENILAVQQQAVDLGLQHPTLIRVYEIFEVRSGTQPIRFYAVQETVEGTLLVNLTAPQPTQNVLGWIQGLLAGLQYLGEKGYTYPGLTSEQICLAVTVQPPELVERGGSASTSSADGGCERLRLANTHLKLIQAERFTHSPEQSQRITPHLKSVLLTFQSLLDTQALSPALTDWFESIQHEGYTSIRALMSDLEQAHLSAETAPANLYWQTGRLTHVGQTRQINEDSLLTLELAQVYESMSQPLALFAVADGMGGHETGEVASRLAAHTLGNALLSQALSPMLQNPHPAPLDYPKLLEDAVGQANLAVYNAAQQQHNNMGTTLVAALLVGSAVYIANMGDSRAYLLDESGIRQVTEDHSYVKLLIDQQQLSPQEAQEHPQANLIYRTLGDKSRVTVDIFQEQLTPDSWLLLCSDGLTGLVSDDTIQQIIQASNSPQDACQQLIKAANDAGGHDNITAITVKRMKVEGC